MNVMDGRTPLDSRDRAFYAGIARQKPYRAALEKFIAFHKQLEFMEGWRRGVRERGGREGRLLNACAPNLNFWTRHCV